VTVVPPQMREGPNWFQGTADAVAQNMNLIIAHHPELVLVFGADHVYRMDVTQMVEFHLERSADITVAALLVPIERASDFGVIKVDAEGRILDFQEKPERPSHIPGDPSRSYASMGNYLFQPACLLSSLREARRLGETGFGTHVLPRMIKDHRIFAYDLATNEIPGIKGHEEASYWRDVSTVDVYFEAHRDLLGLAPRFDVFNPQWPTFSSNYQGPVSRVIRGDIDNSLLGSATLINWARIRSSIIRREAVVEEGVEVEDCVIMDYVRIGRGARLRRTVVDRHNVVDEDARIGHDPKADGERYTVSPNGVVVVSRGHRPYYPRGGRGFSIGYAEYQQTTISEQEQMTKPFTAVWPGDTYPLGATWDGEGVNFALFSEAAERVELCLFDASGRNEIQRVDLPEHTDLVWHGYLPEVRPGQLYGFRVHGPYRPEEGLRFNPKKLLLDPYAKDIHGRLRWTDSHFGYRLGHKVTDLSFDRRDNARAMPKCRVIDPEFTWGDDHPPGTPWHDTLIYELHVKGFTAQHPDVPKHLRGTYAGLASTPVIEYLQRLGVTAVELLPTHAFFDERELAAKGLTNYWGYNSIGYFAPERRYSATGDASEFKTMVRRLHSAGIEVILDVVYNHTAEGNHLGPTLCFRGIDNAAYYRLVGDQPRYYMDYTGCGNTLNMRHPRVLQLIMDSLRYWVLKMHVDGFRFDLASALARELHEVDRLGAFFDIIHQDPVLSQVKLIAEPWDLGEGGYQVGNFPPGWTEWNGKYRDTVRDYWQGAHGTLGELATRLTGSSDLYERGGRRPVASVNFITAHDGFTLRDLVSYNDKHNEANQEDNRDGSNDNRSWNCGFEGPTDDPRINALRERQERNFIATLLLSQGVPMLLAGDELGRSQQGNNNAYCQDNELNWIDWDLTDLGHRLHAFTRRMIRLRMGHPVFRRRRFFEGRVIGDSGAKDILWLKPNGEEMDAAAWHAAETRILGALLNGAGLGETDKRGRPLDDDSFLLLLNSGAEDMVFTLPSLAGNGRWDTVLDTARHGGFRAGDRYEAGETYLVQAHALAVLRQARETGNGNGNGNGA
jgi:isoamylase